MPLYESEAVVLRGIRYRETDRIVTFFTQKFGKVGAVAKGSRRTKSKFGSSLEPFSRVHLIFFGKENANLYQVNSTDLIRSFQSVREDYERSLRAAYFADLVNSTQKEGDPSPKVFSLLTGFLELLEERTSPSQWDALLVLFELRYWSAVGYRFHLDRCVYCKKGGAKQATLGFNPEKGGMVCGDCLGGDPQAERVQPGTINLMRKALDLEFSKLGRLGVSAVLFPQIRGCIYRFRTSHLGFDLKSAKFLNRPPQ
jgi:DNA repair protein RecO (recombination protein O)